MTTTPADLAPLHKSVRVPQQPAEAFRLFTAELGAWWPLATHSVGGDRALGVELEPAVGGRIVETYGAGDPQEAVWGTVLAWEPPSLVRFTWHPGTPVAEATEVEVRFTAVDEGTLVELVHQGWDRRPQGAELRARYGPGWELVLGCLASAAARDGEHRTGASS
jgi:uncharacterized protein YndB with AHSA1/START domain